MKSIFGFRKIKSPPPGGGAVDGGKSQRPQKQSLTDAADDSERYVCLRVILIITMQDSFLCN